MIEAKELRIRNYVSNMYEDTAIIKTIHEDELWSGGYYILTEKNKSALSTITPIPLTEEWLLKFGFKECKHESFYGDYIKGCFKITKEFELMVAGSSVILAELKYTHKLQNIWFELNEGEELEI